MLVEEGLREEESSSAVSSTAAHRRLLLLSPGGRRLEAGGSAQTGESHRHTPVLCLQLLTDHTSNAASLQLCLRLTLLVSCDFNGFVPFVQLGLKKVPSHRDHLELPTQTARSDLAPSAVAEG